MKFEVPEGATPIDDAEGLIPEILTYSDLCAVEAENILEAADRHLSRRRNADAAWLDEAFLRKLHADMYGNVWDWAGRYRLVKLNIGVPITVIPEEIGKLLGDLRYWQTLAPEAMPILERAARLHHRLAWIHPFRNGNGRHARMTADIYLHSQRYALPAWPGEDITAAGEVRRRYLAALKAADKGDFAPLVEFIRGLIPAG